MSELSFSTVGFIIWGCACAVGLMILIVWPRWSGRQCSFLVERTFMVYLVSQLVASIVRVMEDIFVKSSSSWLEWFFWQAMIAAASAYLMIGIVVGTVVKQCVCTVCVCIYTPPPPPPPAVGLGLDLSETNVNAGEMGRNNVNVNMHDESAGIDTVDVALVGMHPKLVGNDTQSFVPVCMSSLLPSQTKIMKLALLVGLLLSVGLSITLLTLQILDRPDLFPIIVFCYYLPAALLSFFCVLVVWWSGVPPDLSSPMWVSNTSCTSRTTGTTPSTHIRRRPTGINTTTTPTNQTMALGIRRLSVIAAIVGMIDFIVPALAYIGLDRYLWEETFVTRVLDSLIYIPLIIPWVMWVSQQAPLDKISLFHIVLFDGQSHMTTHQSEAITVQQATV